VEDDGNVLGLDETDYSTFKEVDKKDAFLKHFDNLLEKFLGNDFNSLVQVDIQDLKGKKVAKICVKKKAPEPTFLNQKGKAEEFYIRRNASAKALTPKETMKYVKEHWD
jgi:hypothetical protein